MFKQLLTTSALAAMFVIGAQTASAQGTTTPGTPNTGAGGEAAANVLILAASALAIVGGTSYLARRVGSR
jgi:hypothetical protein